MSKKNLPQDTATSATEKEAKQMMKNRHYKAAGQLWHQLAQENSSLDFSRKHVNCLVKAGDLAEAAQHSKTYAEKWPEKPVFQNIQLKQFYQQRQWDAAAPIWAQLAKNTREKDGIALSLIFNLLRSQDYSGALNASKQASHYYTSSQKIAFLHQQLEKLYGNNAGTESSSEKPTKKIPKGSDNQAAPSSIFDSINADDQSDPNIITLLTGFVQHWPEHTEAIHLLLDSWWRKKEYKEIVEYCEKHYDETTPLDKRQYKLWSRSLIELEELEKAAKVMRNLQAEDKIEGDVRTLLTNSIGEGLTTNSELRSDLEALCNTHGVSGIEHAINFEESLKPPLRPLVDSFDQKLAVAASPKITTECLAIVFTGFNRRLSTLSESLLDRYLAGQGIAMVRLIDFHEHAYLSGISELGASFNATIEAIKRMAGEYGASRIVTIGNSIGGAGAMYYGATLNASHVLAFSPPTNANIDFLEDNADFRALPAARRFKRLFGSDLLNLRLFIANSPFTGRMDVYAGEKSHNDMSHIKNLEGLNNVHLHAIKGVSKHNCIGPAILDGTLLQALKRLV